MQSLFQLTISFRDLTLVELLSKKKKRVGRDIGTSLHMSQDQQNY